MGSVARLLKNFRFHELRLVEPSQFVFNPEQAVHEDNTAFIEGSNGITAECYEYATPGGAYVLDNARIYGTWQLPLSIYSKSLTYHPAYKISSVVSGLCRCC